MKRRHSWIAGGMAGLAATAVMTVFLVGSERAGLLPGQPPRLVVDRLLPGLDERTADLTALATHAAYGAAGGAAFGRLLPRQRIRTAHGAVFGALLWAAGYEGWVPVLGALPPAHRDRPRRVAVMLAAHLLYGASLGRLLRRA